MSPELPFPMLTLSIEVTGFIRAVLLVKKASLALWASMTVKGLSTISIPSSCTSFNIVFRVMPASIFRQSVVLPIGCFGLRSRH